MSSPQKSRFDWNKNFKYVALVVALLIVSSSSIAYIYAQGPSNIQVAQINQFSNQKNCNYLIFTTGTYYYAEDCSTGAIAYGGPGNAGGATGTNFESVFEATFSTSGISAFIGPGDYVYSIGLNVSHSNDLIMGSGERATIFSYTGSGVALSFGDLNSEVADYCGASNLRISGSGSAAAGLALVFTNYCTFQSIETDSFSSGAGVVINATAAGSDSILNTFYSVRSIQNKLGSSLNGASNSNKFLSSSFDNNVIGVQTEVASGGAPSANVFRDCDYESNSQYGIDDNGFYNIYTGWFESNTVDDVRLGNAAISTQPYIQGQNRQPTYTMGSFTALNPNIIYPNGMNFLDNVNVALGSGVSSYAVSFPSNLAFSSSAGVKLYIVSVEVNWGTSVYVSGKSNTGFTINFGTSTPDSARWVSWTITYGAEPS